MPEKIQAGKREQKKPTISYLSDEAPAEKPWDKHRCEADSVEQMYFAAKIEWMARYGERITRCADVLDFGYKPVKDDSGEVRLALKRSFFCRVRHCPVCQWRRSMQWQARFLQALPQIETDYPTYRWVFLTVTVENCPVAELRQTLDSMNMGFRRMTHRKNWPGVGWVKSLEVTHGKDETAHPHIHCLMLVKPSYFSKYYINQEAWTALWKKSAKLDYKPIVHVTSAKAKNGDMRSVVSEILKYSVKPADLMTSEFWLHSITEQLRRTRAVSIGGVLKEYMGRDEPGPEEPEDDENQGGIRFNWYKERERYARSKKT
jgi:plasmid rolling circle replication initiator protein Rep